MVCPALTFVDCGLPHTRLIALPDGSGPAVGGRRAWASEAGGDNSPRVKLSASVPQPQPAHQPRHLTSLTQLVTGHALSRLA